MHWYNYLAAFFAGAFLANVVPHFVQGICGNRFPTPFAKPPGRGLSSAPVNMIWSLVNLVIGITLLRAGRIVHGGQGSRLAFFLGFAALSIMMSVQFQKKHAA